MTYLRISDMQKKFKVSRSTIYRWVDEKVLPEPKKVGKTPMWIESEVDDYIAVSNHQDDQPTTASA